MGGVCGHQISRGGHQNDAGVPVLRQAHGASCDAQGQEQCPCCYKVHASMLLVLVVALLQKLLKIG